MATPLKQMFNPAFFEKLCPVIQQAVPGFDCRDFIYQIFDRDWPDLELKQRIRQISKALHRLLPPPFSSAANVLAAIADRLHREGIRGFQTMFLPDYVEVYGQRDPDIALDLMETITTLVSCEFAIRPFLAFHPEKVMPRMKLWSLHENAHVRRLSSEGCRPRLPWAARIPQLIENPKPILTILENLKCDEDPAVRRSVANNLNDIAKDHPRLVLKLFKRWQGTHPHTDWILRHASRTLLKQGDADTFSLHGFDPSSRAKVIDLFVPLEGVRRGDRLDFRFNFVNAEQKPQKFRLDYAIDYVTSTGRSARKIFKLKEAVFPPGKAVPISKTQSFKDLSTRQHFQGTHAITIFSNGRKLAEKKFTVH